MAALLCAACWATAGPVLASTQPSTAPSASPASPAACYAFAVSALRRHVVVRRTPPACAGLGAAEINLTVGRAIRTVIGPLPKAAARRHELADSRYLASLVRQGRPPRPAPLTATAAAAPHTLVARLAALAAWLAAALAGGYLLTGLRWPTRRRRRWISGLAGAHALLALSGLCVWVAYLVTLQPTLGWIDVAVTWVLAGMGLATLLADPAGQPARAVTVRPAATVTGVPPGSPTARAPVLVIALHGALATATIVFVLLAVIAAG